MNMAIYLMIMPVAIENERLPIDELLREIPYGTWYIFAAECIKNFIVEENLGEQALADAHRTIRLMYRLSWSQPETYKHINVKQYPANHQGDDPRVQYAYHLMDECVNSCVADGIVDGHISSHANFDAAKAIAKECRNFNGKRSAAQARWQRRRLEQMGRWVVTSRADADIIRRLLLSYAEAVVWKWSMGGGGIHDNIYGAVTIMRSDHKYSDKDLEDMAEVLATYYTKDVFSTDYNDPDRNFATLVSVIFYLWSSLSRGQESVRSHHFFGYIGEWLSEYSVAMEKNFLDARDDIMMKEWTGNVAIQ